ncbi:error-prone DNA polymerase [Actinomadura sp. HBU206391]|uniref:error-prone DNA polymerase n=1 Tax=Actinomadura sp. HBU206391 TaxID=2731692 RepID=UPI00164FFBB4|nr:error-prone DNA polymerase [Actinomadura sp. HBU206391]MBC6459165.1 error-prone DNA polymerase [Actinomadura sp. HBU206391]
MGWGNPPIRWQEFERRLSWRTRGTRGSGDLGDSGDSGSAPHGRDNGEVRELPTAARPGGEPAGGRHAVAWAELHCHSSFSFLDGASSPEALVAEASRLGVDVMAITDHDGMYGAVKFALAARGTEVRTVFGAELSLGLSAPQTGMRDPESEHLLVLARDPEGYRRLCAVISAAQLAGGAKGRPVYDPEMLAAAHDGHWAVLTGCRKGAVPRALREHGPEAAERELGRLVGMFGRGNVFVELTDHDQPGDDARNDLLHELGVRAGVAVVASGNVHYAAPADATLAQVLASVRARSSLDDMAAWLPANGTAHVRSGAEMAVRLARFPGVRERTVKLARACAFDFTVVAPNLPDWPVPEGLTEADWLRRLVAEGALDRYGPPDAETTSGAYEQIARELDVIEQLRFPGYFLIVHDIVAFCRSEDILCQGRGSAANSAVCYALGITGVDAVRHGLLFERFLSPGRDGPPDIDLDIEHRRREEVIQYVYRKYGRDRTAQVANVISYRPKMALRDAARAFGHSPGQQDAWSHQAGAHEPPPPDAGVPAPVTAVAERMQELPRHLGIHSGGMVICDRPVGEVCPVEWARMPNRSVLQWDKDDCATAGLVKFDLLGLGMLSALHDTFDLVAEHHGRRYALHSIPPEDPLVYDMLCDADTVGVFQVESRAQMATLPRLRPRRFYDLVVEVALIRPGPIQGGSVHPYLRRRSGLEEATCPHPLMERSLRRTLGVPLFQEQMMQLAVDCAGFTADEADRLRQAMSAKRAPERIHELRRRLLDGMAERGILEDVAEQVYDKILGFASFGFPESHAQSFAHLVYASAWLKRHYPAAFCAALLRNQPMGFYHPHTLIDDARRHGVVVRGVDVNASDADAALEPPSPSSHRDHAVVRAAEAPGNAQAHPHAPESPQPALRLGLASVRDLNRDTARDIAAGRPYRDMEDLVRRVPLPAAALEALATAGAFGCFGLTRREALWAAGAAAQIRPGQLPGTTPGGTAPPLPEMTPIEETIADLWATGAAHTHPVAHLREELAERGAVTAATLKDLPGETNVIVGGLVTHRQRPGTAGGIIFLNLEDETGMVNVICRPQVWERHKSIALRSSGLLVHGRLERHDGAINLTATRLRRLPVAAAGRSRDFR